MSVTLSVTEMVNFMHMHGDLSTSNFQNNRLLEGIKAHQFLQKSYDDSKQKEVVIELKEVIDEVEVTVVGRMDGVVKLLSIEEIKSTMGVVELIFEPDLTHLAQLKIYAYMYMTKESLTQINGILTYVSIDDYKQKQFSYHFTLEALKPFYDDTLYGYMAWMRFIDSSQTTFLNSVLSLDFPFETYRKGQRAFMKGVYHTVKNRSLVYAVAPTGIGKTLASLFSSLKGLTSPLEKIFYLTAKTEAKQVAYEAVRQLQENGLQAKTLVLTSKDYICFLDKRNCDPMVCPFAKGFFERLKEAIMDIYEHESIFDRNTIESYAKAHTVCPFEFSLEVSNISNIIICDYNYAFDPRARLIRYFEDDTYKPILLIDEAHNLVSRSKDMYSQSLIKSDLITLRKLTRKTKPSLTHSVNKLIHHFDNYEHIGFKAYDKPSKDLMDLVVNLIRKMQKSMDHIQKDSRKSLIMDEYFKLLQFDKILGLYNEPYKTNVTVEDQEVKIELRCLDASQFLLDTFTNKAYGSVLFSATLTPLTYYKTLLSQNVGEHFVIDSPFDKTRLTVIEYPIDTRFLNRIHTVSDILKVIDTVTNSKKGNYICFLPSYQYLELVVSQMNANTDYAYYVQSRDTKEQSKTSILSEFTQTKPFSQVAFFVLGGMFSEGIDYVGDMLNGVIVVGVGLPGFNEETEQLRHYYEQKLDKGFDYAYTYPGMNKVIQAVGRVIRRKDDYGIAILMDDRFKRHHYQKLMPDFWKQTLTCHTQQDLETKLNNFWKKHL
ncbi:MAG: ATP-dependent DNA helicase [Acholeplasma sp.]|nr:ATP-dependent DNA helicase [Acholeplasma sp.]